jgi:phytoene dehydrogenase-like protein
MSEKSNYYKDEMARILPVDQYGVLIQIKTTVGHTKWLALNPSSFQSLQETFKEQITSEGQAKKIFQKWLCLERGEHAPAELVTETMEFLLGVEG